MVVPKGAVSSTEASSNTIHRPSQHLSAVREVVSAGGGYSQFYDEMQPLTRGERWKLLQEAGFSTGIPREHGLAVKADIGLPWAKQQVIMR